MTIIFEFLKKRWTYVLTAIIALAVGSLIGPSQEQLTIADAKITGLEEQLVEKTAAEKDLEKDNESLEQQVDAAAPWFKEQEEAKAKAEAEAEEKAKEEAAEQEVKLQAEAESSEEAELMDALEIPGGEINEDGIKKIVDNHLGGEYSFDNGEISATADLSGYDIGSPEDVAVSSYANLSDELLYYTGWETLTVTFLNVGTISMNRSEKETNEYGDYFPTMEIEERLGF
ncbi:hypothetical protein GKZ89_11835 [Bacillus mangrovi]|uniref:Uncharacterized protein n=1 Tax=Metabacillus mangrovi TaxID=1491830 RepID=A0A7X2S6D2_9BACI|nr:hypothetical protein [Metabacillus mangrovi]MTH54100.1 hypothetical protein [Metabacillus mangrovi]